MNRNPHFGSRMKTSLLDSSLMTKPGVHVAYSVAYLLFYKDTFKTLAFEGMRTSYLVHIFLLAMAIYGITCCYGSLVTMATEVYVCTFAVWRYLKSLFGTQIPWGIRYPLYDLLLWKPCYHGNRDICLYLCCLKVNELHICNTDHLMQQQSMLWLVAMDILLPWQQRHTCLFLLFEGLQISYLVYTSLGATAIHCSICCCGNVVAMATEAYLQTVAFEGIGV